MLKFDPVWQRSMNRGRATAEAAVVCSHNHCAQTGGMKVSMTKAWLSVRRR